MKKIIYVLFILSLTIFASCVNREPEEDYSKYIDENHVVAEMEIKDFGKLVFRLDKSNAPITVEHFVSLSKRGLYNNSNIIRYQPGFVLQGGDGVSDQSTIKGEFSSNGVDNKIVHNTGVISMARATDPDSASSQFFIVMSDSAKSSLDGLYAGFGILVEGWDVLENIANSFDGSEFSDDYYGYYMGFLKESAYIKISRIKIYEYDMISPQ